MRLTFCLLLIAMPQMALAHIGHLGGLAGHDHWVAGAAIGVAVVVGIYGALKGDKDKDQAEDQPSEEELEEASA